MSVRRALRRDERAAVAGEDVGRLRSIHPQPQVDHFHAGGADRRLEATGEVAVVCKRHANLQPGLADAIRRHMVPSSSNSRSDHFIEAAKFRGNCRRKVGMPMD